MPVISPTLLGNRLPYNLPEPQKFDNNSWLQVSALNNFASGIRSDNLLFAWGVNNVYQVGDGTTSNKSLPVQISTSSFTQVSSGFDHSGAITINNQLFVWGNQPAIQTLTVNFSWTNINNGGDHFIAIRNDGLIFTWGLNTWGQLGDNSTISKSSPVQIGNSSYTAISAGYYNSAALTADGRLFVWGLNSSGQLGQGDGIWRSNPVQVTKAGVTSWTSVSAGNQYYLAIDNLNRLYGWGINNVYQLGLNDALDTAARNSPVQIGTSSWSVVSAGGLGDHSSGIDINGNMYVWGNFNSTFVPIPTTIYSWTQLSAGGQHTSAIRSDNTLWTWGLNSSGQLGWRNTAFNRSSPVQVTSSSFTAVSSKYSHTGAITADTNLLTWGLNAFGQLGTGTTLNRSSPVVFSSIYDTSSYNQTVFEVNAGFNTSIVPIAGSVSGEFLGSDFLVMSSPAELSFGTGDFTVELWVYLSNLNAVVIWDFRPSATQGLYPCLYTTGSVFRYFVSSADRIVSTTPYSINTWYHVAIVKISSSTKMYQDGIQVGSTYADTNSYIVGSQRPTIGAAGQTLGNNGVVGYLSNVRMVKGVGVYTANFTVPTTILTDTQSAGTNINAITSGQTSALLYTTLASSFLSSSFTSVVAGGSQTAVILSDGRLFTWGDNSAGQLGITSTISRSNAVQLGNTYVLLDTSIYVWSLSTGSATQNTSITPSLTGSPISIYLDGNSSLYTPGNINITQVNADFSTSEGWFRFSDIGTQRGLFRLNRAGGTISQDGNAGASLSRSSANGFYVYSGAGSANVTGVAVAPGSLPLADTWYHIAWTIYPSNCDIYVNGVRVVNGTSNFRFPFRWGPGSLGLDNNCDLAVGIDVFGGQPFLGYVSNVRITKGNQVYTGASFTVPTSVLQTTQSSSTNISAITSDQVLLLAGTNTSSAAIVGSVSWSTVDSGDKFMIAKDPSGSLYGWGLNTSGQVGVGNIINRSNPVLTAAGSWLQVSTGFDHTLAIRSDNTLWTWGNFNAISLVTEVQSWITISGGSQNTLAIKSDGTLWAWGANAQGQVGDATVTLKNSPVFIGAASWASVASGNSSSYAINDVGALYTWGWNSSGQLGLGNSLNRSSPTLVISSQSWSLIKPGFDHVEAIDTLGLLYSWGNYTTGQTGVEIYTTDSWVSIANGLALRADNTLWSWNNNVGDGTTVVRYSPVQIGSNDWLSIALSYDSSYAKAAIKTDYTLWMWGDNSNGQLGQNDTINRSSPVQVAGSWLQVSTQLSNTAAINSSNIIYTWGNNSSGQLGDNTTINKSSPVTLAAPFNASNWTLVSVGYSHMAAIRSDGALYLWGRNNIGQLGNNNPGVNRSNPVLTTLTTSSFTIVSAGASHNIALRATDRALFGWGAPWGNGTTPSGNNISAPQQIGTSSWLTVAAGADSSYAINLNGSLWAWGTNNNGLIAQNINWANFNAASVPIQLGVATNWLRVMPAAAITSGNAAFVWGPQNSAFNNTGVIYSSLVQVGSKLPTEFYTPQQVGTSSWITVESGSSFTVGIDSNNQLYGWGLNTSGQLADRTTISRSSPVQLLSGSWIAIAAEFDHVLAIRSDTTLWTWGNSSAIGLITYPQSWSQISAGLSHTLAIRSDGALFTWGLNSSGQLGTGNLTDRASPTLLGFNAGLSSTFIGSSSWSQVSAGTNFSLAIDVNNRMFAWGTNGSFQLGDGFNISKSLPVQIGYTIVDQSTYNNNFAKYGQFLETVIVPFNNSVSIQSNPSLTWAIQTYYSSNTAIWYDNDYMMECWIFPLAFAVSATNSLPLVMGHGLPYTATTYWAFGVNTSGSVLFYYFNGSTNYVIGGGGGTLNAWQHIAMTHTNSTGIIRLYHNGVLVASVAKVGSPQSNSIYQVYIGSVQATAFNGYISNVRIVKGNVVYTGQFNPQTSPLTATQSAGVNINAITSGQTSLLILTSPASVISPSWTSVSAGGDHALATTSDGKLYSWGNNDNGQAGRYNPANSYTSVYAGADAVTFISIRNDSTLWAWGFNDYGQLLTRDVLARSSPVQVAAGSWTYAAMSRYHGMAIRDDGTLWVWGYNGYGQLGINNTIDQYSPVQLTSVAESWIQVTAGTFHSLGITTTGKLYAWGRNISGQLGDNSIINKSTPVQITSVAGSWSQIRTTGNIPAVTAGILNTGIMYTWGLNNNGQLGIGLTTDRSNPTLLASPFNTSSFSMVSVGGDYMMAILGNGAMYGWGTNDGGQLGNNTIVNRSNPTLVVGTTSWTSVATTWNSPAAVVTAAIATNGSLWTWGRNNSGWGTLGDGFGVSVSKSSPVQISSSSFTMLAAGDGAIIAERIDGLLFSWGLNTNAGQLGLNDALNRSSPVLLGNLPDLNRWSPAQVGSSSWSMASAGVSFSSGIDSAGALYGWGLNTSRQVGDATTISKFSPVVIASGSWTKVDSGSSHSLAIRSDGSLWTWGIGAAINVNNVTPFSWSQLAKASGNATHMLAIRNDGSLWGWGVGTSGQLGDNTVVTRSSPVLISSDSWTSISVGQAHSAAIRLGGLLFVWGLGTSGQLGLNNVISRSVPTQIDSNSWASVSVGNNSTAGIRNNELYMWGDNTWGQLGQNNVILRSSPVQVAGSWNSVSMGGQVFTVAINSLNDLFAWGYNGDFNLGTNNNISRSSPIQINTSNKFTTIATGERHSLVIDTNNKAWTWGNPDIVPVDVNSWTQISYGESHAVALRSDGRIFAWGLNSNGQCGTNDTVHKSSPVLVGLNPSSTSYTSVYASFYNSYAITSLGTLFGWGDNSQGSLGDGTTINRSNPTILFSGSTKFLGLQYGAFVDTTDIHRVNPLGTTVPVISQLQGGYNGYSVSFGGAGYLTVPLLGLPFFDIPAATNWTFECFVFLNALPAGANQYVIANRNWAFGVSAPTWGFSITSAGVLQWNYSAGILLQSAASAITTGSWIHVAFVKNTSNLASMYINGVLSTSVTDTNAMSAATGDLFIGVASNLAAASYFNGFISDVRIVTGVAVYTGAFTVPTRPLTVTQSSGVNIGALTGNNISQVTGGIQWGMALTSTGKLYTWGYNWAGQLGINTTTNRSSPVVVTANGASFVSISSGSSHATAVDSNGSLYTWGYQTPTQNLLGTGQSNAVTSRSMPVQIAPNTSWSLVRAGYSHSAAIDTNSKLYLWGIGTSTNLTTQTFSWTQIVASEGNVATNEVHTLAIRSDGLLYGWGYNSYGQLGTFDTGTKNSPTLVTGAFGVPGSWYGSWVNVAAGWGHSLGVNSDGRVYTWGQNNNGQLGQGDTINRSAPTLMPQALFLPTNFVEQISNSQATVNAFVSFTTDNTLYPGAITLSTVSTPNSGRATTPGNANLLMTGDFTIEFYLQSTNNGAINQTIRLPGTDGWWFRWLIATNANLEFYITQTAWNAGTPTLVATSAIAINIWYHIAVTRLGSTIRLWVNGVNVATGTYVGNVGDAANALIYADGDGTGAAGSNQNINNVRIVNGTALYTEAFVPYRGPFTRVFGSQTVVLSLTTGVTLTGTPAINRLAAGELHSAITLNDGRLFTFGSNNIGQLGDGTTINKSSPVLIGSVSDSYTQISTGLSYTVALRNNGTLWAWGLNSTYQLGDGTTLAKSSPVLIGGSNSFTAISSGQNHNLAISSNFNLWAWGDINNLVLQNIDIPVSWAQVRPGAGHTIGLRGDGILFAWGLNNAGQLGDGTTINKSSPVVVGNLSYSAIGAGQSHSFAIRVDGAMFAWGLGTSGQLGDNTAISKSSPVLVQAATISFTSVTGGALHSSAVDTLGRLYVWGANAGGQLGTNNVVGRSTPLQLGTNSWVNVSAGLSNVLAIRNDYTLWSWGLNTSFQIGDGTSITKSSPVQIGVGSSWNVISSEWEHSAAINSSNKLYVWGPAASVLLQTGPLSWSQIANGSFNRVAIREDGSLWAWGNGGNGAIGDGTTISKSSPVLISSDWSWNAVAAGQHVCYAIRGDGRLFAWGLGLNGVLGGNDVINRSSPVQIGTNSWVAISASTNSFAIAKRADGTIWTWGLNGSGQLGDNSTITKSSPVQVGTSSWKQVQAGGGSVILGIFNDDKLYVWGNNFQGNLGLNDTVDRSNPTQLGTESYILISAGAGGAGIRPDNTLFVWGPNTGGKLGQNDAVARSSPVQIAGSWSQVNVVSRTFGIRTDGTLWAIGNNNQGQLGDGTTITKSSPVQIGTSSWTAINVGLDPGASINNIMYFWGQNQSVGTFGFGDTIDRSSPVILGSTNINVTTPYIIPTKVTNVNYSFVSVGASFTTAISTATNTIFSWGLNNAGQLADNSIITRSSPVAITSSIAFDVSPYSSTLVLNGAASIVTSVVPIVNAVSFSGTGVSTNFVTITSSGAQLNLNNVDWTLEMFVYLNAYPATNETAFIQSQTGGGGWVPDLGIGIIAAGNVRIFVAQGATNLTDTLNLSTWYHLALVRFSGTTRFYINGVATNYSSTGNVQSTNLNFWVGKIDNTPGGGGLQVGLNGFVSNLRITRGVAVYTGNFTTPTAILPISQNSSVNISAILPNQTSLLLFTNSASFSNWQSVQNGSSNGVVTTTAGYILNFGFNGFGQFGNNSTINRSNPTILTNQGGLYTQIGTPRVINNSFSWSQIAAGSSHSVTRTIDNLVYTWGLGTSGQLGTNDAVTRSNPTLISASSPVLLSATQIAAGRNISYLRNSANLLFSWGLNTAGEIGQNNLISRSMPTQLNITAVLDSGTAIPTLVQRNNIVVSDLSTNNLRLSYQFGAEPISFGPFTPSSSIALNLQKSGGVVNNCDNVITPSIPAFSIGSYNDYTIECWVFLTDTAGFPHFYSMGIPGVEARSRWYIQSGNLSFGVSAVGAWTWSSTVAGSIGTFTTNVWYHTAVVKSGNTLALYWNGSRVALNSSFTVPVGYGGSMWIGSYFNDNDNNQGYTRGYISNFRMVAGTALYSGTTYTIPTAPFTAIANTVLLLSSNSYVPAAPSYTQVGIGTSYTIALRSDNTLWAWGLNTSGQLGDTTAITKSSPTMLFAGGRWSSIGVGKVSTNYAISLAKSTQNRLFTWGLNNVGQTLFFDLVNRSSPTLVFASRATQIPSMVRPDISFNAISAGQSISMVRRSSDNVALIWGLNSSGEYGDRSTINSSRSKPVVVGSYYFVDQSLYNLFPSSTGGSPKLVDFSPFANEPYDITVNGGSVEFNGVNDSATLSLPYNLFNIGTNDACIEVWAYWNTFRTGTSYMTLFGQNSGNVSTIRIQSNFIGADASVRYTINNDTPRGETAILADTWYHLVVTISNGVARFFVNGVLRDYVTGLGPVIIRSSVVEGSNQSFVFANEDSGWFNGYMSNFRFSNGSIPTLYQTASTTINATIFSVPTSPLTTTSQGATAANVVLLCFTGMTIPTYSNSITNTQNSSLLINSLGQLFTTGANSNGTLADGSGAARSRPIQVGLASDFRSVNTGIISPVLVTSGSWSSISAGLSTSSAIRNDNTLWLWGFNTSGQLGLTDATSKKFVTQQFTVTDTSTYAARILRNGTGYTTSVVPVAGAVSGSFNIVGLEANEFVYFENPSQLILGTNSFTIECWIYPTDLTTGTNTVINWTGTNGTTFIYINTSNLIWNNTLGAPVPPTNVWTHLVVQRQNANLIRIFYNGVQVSISLVEATNYASNALRPEIGYSSNFGGYFNGYISNFRIVTGGVVYRPGITVPTTNLSIVGGTLPTNTILLACQSATIIDNSINNYTITVNGQTNVQSVTPFASPGFSVFFDGTGDWLQLPSSTEYAVTAFTNYTVECWFYATALPATIKALVVNWTTTGGTFFMGIDANNRMNIRTGADSGVLSGTTTIAINTWYHMCFVKDAATVVYGYLNGLLEITSGSFTWANPATLGVSIGGTTTGANPFTGYISNVRIVKNILPYVASFPVPTAPLTTTESAGNYKYAVTATQTVLLTYTTPASITSTSYSQVSTKNATLYLDNTNSLYSTGINNVGQMGIAVTGNRSLPVQVGLLGQTINTYTNSPVQVTPGTSGYAQVWAGQSFSAARRTNNDIFTWGLGTSGQLGLGDAITRSSPTLMSSTQSWNQVVSVGYSHWVTVRNVDFNFLDSSIYNFTITKQSPNTEYNTTVIPFANAVSVFQRANDPGQTIAAQTAMSFGTGEFTIECWVYPLSVNSIYSGIFDARSGATGTPWCFGLRTVSSTARVDFFTGGALTGATSIPNNTWTHIAATRSGTTINIWVNGVLDTAFTSQTAALNPTNTNQLIGRLIDTPAYALIGYISNLRIVKGVAVYTGAFTVPTSPLNATQSSGVNIAEITGTATSLLTFRTEASSVTWQANNKIYVQGGDGSGQLGTSGGGSRTSFVLVGNGTHLNSGTLSPVQVGFGLPNTWTEVSAGTSYSYAKNSSGSVYSWGLNTNSLLLTGDSANRSSPYLIGSSVTWFDKSQYVTAISGNPVALSTTGGPFTGAVTAQFNSGTQLNFPVNSRFDFNTANIEFWFYPTSYGGMVFSYCTPGWLESVQCQWGTAGSLSFPSTTLGISGFGSPGGGVRAGFSCGSPALNTWTHISINLNVGCFHNGVLVSSGSNWNPYAVGVSGYGSPNLYIGVGVGAQSGGSFSGFISNFRFASVTIYTGTFTPPLFALQTSGSATTGTNAFTSPQISALLFTDNTSITGSVTIDKFSTGSSHLVITYPNNNLYLLGLNSSGQLGDNTTTNRTSFVLVGNYFNTNTISPVLAASASWSSISAGTSYTLAIKSDSTLWAWGLNNIGQLGNNSTINRSSIVQVSSNSFSIVIAGHSTSVAIDTSSRLFAWGLGSSGQLGQRSTATRSSPVQVGTSSWTAVATGNIALAGILPNGLLYVWGGSASGQSGMSVNISRSSPTLVQGINYETKSPSLVASSWTSVSAGLSFTAATNSTAAYVWGLNTSGELGLYDTINRSSPTVVGVPGSINIVDNSGNNSRVRIYGPVNVLNDNSPFSGSSALQFETGLTTSLTTDLSANWNWGSGDFTIEHWILMNGAPAAISWLYGSSQFGVYIDSNSYAFESNPAVGTLTSISSPQLYDGRWHHVACVRASNQFSIYVDGVRGAGPVSYVTSTFNETGFFQIGMLAGNPGTRAFFKGYLSNFRVVKGTAVYTGASYTVPTSPLTAIAGTTLLLANTQYANSRYKTIVAGSASTYGISDTDNLYAWGLGTTGQNSGYLTPITRSNPNQIGLNYINVNPSSPVQIASGSWTSVKAGLSLSAAIRSDGTLFTWGTNVAGGQLGDNTLIAKSSPTQVIQGGSFTQVSLYDSHILSVSTDTLVYAWGVNTGGRLGVGDGVSRSSPTVVLSRAAIDTSTNAWTVSIVGTIVYSITFIPFTNAVSAYFDGATTYVEYPQATSVQSVSSPIFTVEAWIYCTNISTNPTIAANQRNGSPTNSAWELTISSNFLRFYYVVGSGGLTFQGSSLTIASSTWTHVAVTRNASGLMNLWVNGIADANTRTDLSIINTNSVAGIRLGANNSGSQAWANGFQGYISNFRWVSGVAVYTGNFTVPTTPLLATQSAGTNISAVTGTQTTVLIFNNTSSITPLNATSIAAGLDNSLAISSNGLYAWGTNTTGQLGTGNVINRSLATQIGTSSWTSVYAGGSPMSAAIRSDGALFNWGLNVSYSLGNMWDTVNRSSPVQIGNNYAGQGTNYTRIPLQVNTTSWKAIEAGNSTSLAISSQDRLFTWGLNTAGQIDQNDTINRSNPVQVGQNLYLQATVGTSNMGAIGKAT